MIILKKETNDIKFYKEDEIKPHLLSGIESDKSISEEEKTLKNKNSNTSVKNNG